MSTQKRSGADFDREIHSHLEIEAARLIEEGWPAAAAAREARRRFGNVTIARERFYDTGRFVWVERVLQDIRCASRAIRRAPSVAFVAILSLAAGIGATTVTLTVRDIVFNNYPPLYREPEQLSLVQVSPSERPIMPLGSPVPAPLFRMWQDALGPAIGASTSLGVRDVRTNDRTDTALVRPVTPGVFALLGVDAEIGRADLTSAAAQREGRPAVLAYRLWDRLFERRPDAIGQTLWIDNVPYTVVGIMPQRFWFGDMNSPVWTVLDDRMLGDDDFVEAIVRRPSQMTPDMLVTRLRPGLAAYSSQQPAGRRDFLMKVSGVEGTPVGKAMSFVLPYVLGTAVLLTLLIACANVALLMIAQWTGRAQEIAIRASIGGTRSRIVRSLLTESVLIAVMGGLAGVAATFALRGWIASRAGTGGFYNFSVEPSIFFWTAAITLLTGIAAGIAPALYETRRLHVNPLRTLSGSDRIRQRSRNALVVFEITVTMALLVVTSAILDGYQRTRRAQLGYDTRPLLSARIENPRGVPVSQVLDVLARIPGVATAAAASNRGYVVRGERVQVSGDSTGANAVGSYQTNIGPDFFSALGVKMRSGRPFSTQESPSSGSRVAIVNQALVRRLAQGDTPARIWIGTMSYDVIGVVSDYASNPMHTYEIDPRVFLPLPESSKTTPRLDFLIRATGDPGPLTQTVRQEIREALTGTVVTSASTADQLLTVIGQEILVGTAPLFPLIVIGMLLTTAGIYGVLAFAVTRRSRELAVRVAVGADRWDLVRLVSTQSLKLVGVGCTFGIGLTFALSRVVRASGGAGSIWDPAWQAFIAPLLIIAIIGVFATWLPSRRAMRINPAALLRTDN
jgi:predicted permease